MLGLLVDALLAAAVVGAYFLGHRRGRAVAVRAALPGRTSPARPPRPTWIRRQRVARVFRITKGAGGVDAPPPVRPAPFRTALEDVR